LALLKTEASSLKTFGSGLGLTSGILLAVLVALLWGNFVPGQTQFSNDGPLGRLVSACHRLPERFTGCWEDLNAVGYREASAVPNITFGLQWILGPVWFSKLYAPVSLMILGLGAWCFFRQIGLGRWACLIAALAAVLNSSFFSAACWGVGAHVITVGMSFFALAALTGGTGLNSWCRVGLAGLAVGMGVSEGADLGAIFSIFVAVYLVYQTLIARGQKPKKFAVGSAKLALVAVCAGLLAAQAVSELIANDIKGISGTQQDARTKAERWDWATQWSLPKAETLRLVVPGLFGYRDDTPDGGRYWGSIGRAAEWDRYVEGGKQGPEPTGFVRYSGGGFYAGIAVVLIAAWAVIQAWRRDSVFNLLQKKWLWFWCVIGIVSLLLSFGRYAPFYRWLYALPYFSTVRNPAKFTHLLSLSLIVMFAYGVDGLGRKYAERPDPAMVRAWNGAKEAPGGMSTFEKWWVRVSCIICGTTVVGWIIFWMCRQALERYLMGVQFDETSAHQIASFSVQQPGWFLLFFAPAAGLLWLLFRGTFSGKATFWWVALLGLLLALDLGRANQPWIVWWNYTDKYASNPVLDLLRDKPYEHRVAMLTFNGPSNLQILNQLHRIEWSQHAYQYYNIQSLDIVQLPREPQDMVAFDQALKTPNKAEQPRLATRRWELTNTRYILGVAVSENEANKEIDPEKRRMRIAQKFRLVAKPGVTHVTTLDEITAELDPNGPYAVYEFTGALPRAKFYNNWETQTNSAVVLKELAAATFDPTQNLIVQSAGLPSADGAAKNGQPAPVEFVHYSPRDIVLNCEQQSAGVLLLNDRYDPNWNVRVDGSPAQLLRCNYFMKGVYLETGKHLVEFRFQPSFKLMYVSCGALLVGMVLLGVVMTTQRRGASMTVQNALWRNNNLSATSKAGQKRSRQVEIKVGK
jgi:hypothetical protein